MFRVEIALSAHIKTNGFQNEGNKARENRSRIFPKGFFFFGNVDITKFVQQSWRGPWDPTDRGDHHPNAMKPFNVQLRPSSLFFPSRPPHPGFAYGKLFSVPNREQPHGAPPPAQKVESVTSGA